MENDWSTVRPCKIAINVLPCTTSSLCLPQVTLMHAAALRSSGQRLTTCAARLG